MARPPTRAQLAKSLAKAQERVLWLEAAARRATEDRVANLEAQVADHEAERARMKKRLAEAATAREALVKAYDATLSLQDHLLRLTTTSTTDPTWRESLVGTAQHCRTVREQLEKLGALAIVRDHPAPAPVTAWSLIVGSMAPLLYVASAYLFGGDEAKGPAAAAAETVTPQESPA